MGGSVIVRTLGRGPHALHACFLSPQTGALHRVGTWCLLREAGWVGEVGADTVQCAEGVLWNCTWNPHNCQPVSPNKFNNNKIKEPASEFHAQTHHQTAGSGWKWRAEVGLLLGQWTRVGVVGGAGTGGAREGAAVSAQFCWEPETALKISVS